MKKHEIISCIGNFTWMWDHRFFIETEMGNFIWSDPEYDGDNSLVAYEGSYGDYCKESGIDFGRDKGTHVIKDFCGPDFWIKKEKEST